MKPVQQATDIWPSARGFTDIFEVDRKSWPFIVLRFRTRAFLVHCPGTTPRYGFLPTLSFSTY
jgi:hypothetical protein